MVSTVMVSAGLERVALMCVVSVCIHAYFCTAIVSMLTTLKVKYA